MPLPRCSKVSSLALLALHHLPQGIALGAGKPRLFARAAAQLLNYDTPVAPSNSRTKWRSRRTHAVFEMSTEEAVGILSYANSFPGFRGILKQRFSDFIVNEVDLAGNVTHLTDLEAPSQISGALQADVDSGSVAMHLSQQASKYATGVLYFLTILHAEKFYANYDQSSTRVYLYKQPD